MHKKHTGSPYAFYVILSIFNRQNNSGPLKMYKIGNNFIHFESAVNQLSNSKT